MRVPCITTTSQIFVFKLKKTYDNRDYWKVMGFPDSMLLGGSQLRDNAMFNLVGEAMACPSVALVVYVCGHY